MIEKDTSVPLKKALESPKAQGIDKEYIEILLGEDTPILCINRSTQKKRLISFKVLYNNNRKFWDQGGGWEYFITEENLEKVKDKNVKNNNVWEIKTINTEYQKDIPPSVQGYGTEEKTIAAMTEEEQIKKINENKKRLDEIIAAKNKDPEIVTGALVDTTRDAALINHIALKNAMNAADDEAKKITQNLVNSTTEMVKSSTHLISENILNDELMHTLVEKSNGTIVQHMTRVFLSGISFLSFYNKLVSSSSVVNKLRISFANRYKNFYSPLLPHINSDDINIERVFYRGMRAITPEDFSHWATGFLIHDIGKAAAIEYHEGEAAYNRDIVTEHVKLGYSFILGKTNYPREAALICGYHHEYYGDSAGYGYFRSYLEQHIKENPHVKPGHCIAFELEPMLDCLTLGYFPAKILEIVDVYDSVTDPNRIYRKAMTPLEALAMMREEFIVKHPKLDAILFDIFVNYIKNKTPAASGS